MSADRLDLTRAERLAVWRARRADGTATLPGYGQSAAQACPDCGRVEVAGYYCSACFLPIYRSDWTTPEASVATVEALRSDATPSDEQVGAEALRGSTGVDRMT